MTDKTQFLAPEQLAENRERFLQTLRDKVKRDGIEDLIAYLEDSDFFTAPSSTRFHGNYEGGLCEHSLNVYDCLVALHQKYEKFEYTDETLAIATLMHDLCKIRVYSKQPAFRKDADGRWEQYMSFKFDEVFPGGHGEKSCFIIQQFMKLTPDEYLAIRWHMNGFDNAVKGGDRAMSAAAEKCKLVPMLQLADMEASHMLEITVEH